MMMLARIVAIGIVAGLVAGARQAPAPPFFFVQMTDPQFGMFTSDADFSQETLNLELAIATVNRWRPAFVIVTGDLVNKAGDAAQVAEYQRIVRRLDPSIPIYHVAGNHDVGNVPTPASLSAYVARFGRDYYSFTSEGLAGVVLNSSLIHSPDGAPQQYQAQLVWLRAELSRLRAANPTHLVVFQHHPWFLARATEADQYFNIPLERRTEYLSIFRGAGIRHLFSGHYHRNAVAEDEGFEMVTTGSVGMPLGEGTQSGLRVVIVRDGGLSHRYYALGELPNRIDLKTTVDWPRLGRAR
jgi:3',5'-cyclic AMP phosphodiesterase CpdA